MLIETFIQVRGPLFDAVQSAHLFHDDKVFVDAVLKTDPEEILKNYELVKNKENFNLEEFIHQHFTLPQEKEENFITTPDISVYIEKMWDLLTRSFKLKENYSTLISLPFPHIVPGGRFREVYYWDSYFIIEGLVVSQRFDLIENIVKNLAFLIDQFGFVPNGNRFYYLTRSQQPYFSLIIDLLHREGLEALSLSFYPQLLREYHFWMNGENLLTEEKPSHKRVVMLKNGHILNRYFDEVNHPREEAYSKDLICYNLAKEEYKPCLYRNLRAACESGWDFSSRFLRDPQDLSSVSTLDFVPVDLNCLLFHHEMLLAKFADLLNNEEDKRKYEAAADRRKLAILQYCWDGKRSFFFDYDVKKGKCSESFSLAATFPLFFEICDETQAKCVKDILERKFLKEGGLVTTLCHSKQQWDFPNGWAPLQLIAYMGLKNYGFDDLAKEIAIRFVGMCRKIFAKTQTVFEKYNVENPSLEAQQGEYHNQRGFGWTNAVIKVFLDELKS